MKSYTLEEEIEAIENFFEKTSPDLTLNCLAMCMVDLVDAGVVESLNKAGILLGETIHSKYPDGNFTDCDIEETLEKILVEHEKKVKQSKVCKHENVNSSPQS